MPETRPDTRPVIAMVMLVSAITLFVLAALIFMGVVPLGSEIRLVTSVAVGVAAFADLCVAIWFFRKSQSS